MEPVSGGKVGSRQSLIQWFRHCEKTLNSECGLYAPFLVMAVFLVAFDTIQARVFLDLSLGLKIEICFHDKTN